MPQDLIRQNVNFGDVLFNWSFDEYEKYDRSHKWYFVAGGAILLLLIYSTVTANYLFALIIVLFAIIILLQEMRQPSKLDFAITDTGIVVGRRYYPFSELEKFWIIYNPPMVQVLYFEPKSAIKHRLHIPILDEDPQEIRSFLNQFLEEDLDKEEEPLSDRLGRLFKIQ